MPSYRLAIDTGGTFCDFVLLNESDRSIQVFKLPSTPTDPCQGVLSGIALLAKQGVNAESISFLAHGTTVATNALLEEKGARTGLLITEGFRGIYDVADQTRGYGPSTYDLGFSKPRPLAPQKWTQEIRERVAADGTVLISLDEDRARLAIRWLRAAGVDSIAVCLLFSFLLPDHENRVAEIIAEEFPEASVSLSSRVLPQIREYFRLSTTVINAYVAPVVSRYLQRLDDRLKEEGLGTPARYVMQSNGGVASFRRMAEEPVKTILSGPAAGVISGMALSVATGRPNLVTFDMGGTSSDVALIEGGRFGRTSDGQIVGRHVNVPMIDIHTVGAGGGTIARVTPEGVLAVGPQSAGADPGPACYGLGGQDPTVTDAALVLGYLNPKKLAGGAVRLDIERAMQAIATRVAMPLGLSINQAAMGIIEIVNVHMEDGIRVVSSQRGYDIRDFALAAFGGAGPVHASRLAADLGMREVIVPRWPGVTSALGLLMADVRHDYVRSQITDIDKAESTAVKGILTRLRDEAAQEMAAEGHTAADVTFEYALDLRYAGQGYELSVPLTEEEAIDPNLPDLRNRFDALHARLHGHNAPDSAVQIVSFRVAGIAHVPKATLAQIPESKGDDPTAAGKRFVSFDGLNFLETPVYLREELLAGHYLKGPAIIEQDDSTTVVQPGQSAIADAIGNLILKIGGDQY